MRSNCRFLFLAMAFILAFRLNVVAADAAPKKLKPKPTVAAEDMVDLSEYKIDAFPAGVFGEVIVFGADKVNPSSLSLVLSGDGQWDANFKRMMKGFAKVDGMYVIIKTITYMKNANQSKEKCFYPAADLESLSHLIQKKYKFAEYVVPTLIGYSSGATLAYGVLAQSPVNTFRGAISLGFCTDLEVIKRPLCPGSGKLVSTYVAKTKSYELAANHHLELPWYVINGTADTVCDFARQKAFTAGLPNTKLIALEGVGHGFLDAAKWVPEYKKAFEALVEPAHPVELDASLKDLPLIEVKAPKPNDTLVVILSGDGGWASLDKDIAKVFQKRSYDVVGVDSLKYFWSPKNPEKLSHDLARVAEHYLKAWKKEKILWIGYSMGADVLPFGVTRLPSALQAKTVALAYLGLSTTASFEFHLMNWLKASDATDGLPIQPEIEKLSEFRNICIRGLVEKSSGCDSLTAPVRVIKVPGGHHFNGDYEQVATQILRALP